MERINRVPKELGMKLLLLKAFCQLRVRKMVGLVSQKKCWCWAQGKLEEVKRRTRVCCIPRLWAAREAGTRPSICVLFLLPVYLSSSRTFLSLCPPFRAALHQGVEQESVFVSSRCTLFRTSHSSHTCCYRAGAETSPYKNTSATILESR